MAKYIKILRPKINITKNLVIKILEITKKYIKNFSDTFMNFLNYLTMKFIKNKIITFNN